MANMGPTVVATMTIELILAVVAVGARIYTRTLIIRSLGWDDALLLIGLALTVVFTAGMYVCVGKGYGKRAIDFSPERYSEIVKAELIAQTFAVVAFAPAKAAVGATVMRIFPGRMLHGVLWFLNISVTLIFIVDAIMDFTQCNPPAHRWNPTISASCWDPQLYTNYSIFTGAWGALYDFALAAIPWRYIVRLQMKLNEKLAVGFAMSLGVFAGICAIVKTFALRSLSSRTNYAYDTVGLILWSATELCVIFVAASIPTLRPLFSKAQGQNDTHHARGQHIQFQTYSSRKGAGNQVNRIPLQMDSEEAVLTGTSLGQERSDRSLSA